METAKYSNLGNSAGQDNLGQILTAILSFRELKKKIGDRYDGGILLIDEVDAALDKRNSERLAVLIKKYMKTGQYIIVTHNDAIITESTLLYGISMQDGISKILSLEV